MDLTQPLSRRQMTRLLAGGSLALVAGSLLTTKPASAGISWCRSDPKITVNGKSGHVYVESTEAMFASATGPVAIEILVPKGTLASASAVPLDNAFGYGYAISFKEDGKLAVRGNYVEVRVRSKAPALDGSLPVRVIFHADDVTAMDSTKTSTANTWIETGAVKL